MNTYLFVLCPPFSGSTALWSLLSTSAAVSCLPGEGQFLPEVRDVMRADPWDPKSELPWNDIKRAWHGYWDPEKPWLVEKSPPHIIRAHAIERYFQPVRFLVMVRNPFAHCASLIRRNGWAPERAAEFSLRCLRAQKDNASTLGNVTCFTYEAFASDPQSTARTIEHALPGIGPLAWDALFTLHSSMNSGANLAAQRIVNHNRHAVDSLSTAATESISRILGEDPGTIRYWGYDTEPTVS